MVPSCNFGFVVFSGIVADNGGALGAIIEGGGHFFRAVSDAIGEDFSAIVGGKYNVGYLPCDFGSGAEVSHAPTAGVDIMDRIMP